jgi:hypothetical protein
MTHAPAAVLTDFVRRAREPQRPRPLLEAETPHKRAVAWIAHVGRASCFERRRRRDLAHAAAWMFTYRLPMP